MPQHSLQQYPIPTESLAAAQEAAAFIATQLTTVLIDQAHNSIKTAVFCTAIVPIVQQRQQQHHPHQQQQHPQEHAALALPASPQQLCIESKGIKRQKVTNT